MSFYSDASLVLIPSGYKDQKIYAAKPTDGLGDLVFSRASSATRVASNGLIEKVRTNVVLYSNDFSNAAWNQTGVTATSGETDYLGGTNAWKITPSTSNIVHYITQNTPSSVYSSSIYIKAAGYTTARIITGGFAAAASIDLITGATTAPAKTTNVGNGWWRFEIYNATAGTGFYIYPVGTGAYAGDGTSGILVSFAQAETGDIATDYIETTTAAVSVGPVSGLPRLDYLNSSCPRLILEPTRTNLITYDSYYGTYTISNATLASNVVTSPDGYQDASSITQTTTTAGLIRFPTISYTSGTTYTHSIFVKQDTKDFVFLTEYASSGVGGARTSWFSFATKTWTTLNTAHTGSYVDYGNGWLRLTITFEAGITLGRINDWGHADTTNSFTVVASGVTYFYGAQCEVGSYMTSLIPTNGTSVTRVADAASKTGISSLIGQTEGTLFVEMKDLVWTASALRLIGVSDGTFNNRVALMTGQTSNTYRVIVTNGGALQTSTTASGTFGNVKVALAYSSAGGVIYVNGTQVLSYASISVPSTSAVYLGMEENGNASSQPNGPCSQALLFKTRLTNAQLAELTTL